MSAAPSTVAVRENAFAPPVHRMGSGDPILFLHHAGGLASGLGPDLQMLAQHYEVIAPVHPGWDDTEGLEAIDDIHDLVVYYQDLVDSLGLSSFHLMGHSIGGMFAAELAAARPDLVRKLVLVAPVGLWMDDKPVTDLFSLLPQELPQYLFADPESELVRELFPPTTDLDAMAERMYLQLSNMAAAGKFMWPIPDKGLTKRLHRIKAETLIVWGKQDRVVPVEYADLFAQGIANARVQTLDGAGHMLPVEKPQAVAESVRGFLG